MEHPVSSPYPKVLAQLNAFNLFVTGHPELSKLLVFGDWNYLQMFQYALFYDLDKRIDASAASGLSAPRKQRAGLRIRMRQIAAILYSALSFLFLVASRRTVLVFAADKATDRTRMCDFRMANLFTYLFEREVPFMEVFHANLDDSFLRRMALRMRPALYLEALDTTYTAAASLGLRQASAFRIQDVDFSAAGEQQVLFRSLAQGLIAAADRSAFKISLLRLLLSWSSIKILLATSDTRNYNELVAACNALSIRTYGFQSGNFSKYDFGYIDCSGARENIPKPDKLIAETEYWKQELLRLGTYFAPDEIEAGGNMKEDYQADGGSAYGASRGGTILLVPYEIAAPKAEVSAYIRKILQSSDIAVVFKARADRNLMEQVREYGLEGLSGNLTFITDLQEMGGFDVVAGTYSTFLYEMIGKRKPVVLFKTSLDYGEGLVINGLAEELVLEDERLLERLRAAKDTPSDVLDRRLEVLYGGYVPLAATLEKIIDAVGAKRGT